MIATRFLPIQDFELYGNWLREQSAETLATYFGIAVSPTFVNSLVDGIVSNPEEHYFDIPIRILDNEGNTIVSFILKQTTLLGVSNFDLNYTSNSPNVSTFSLTFVSNYIDIVLNATRSSLS